jgi:hypothetical protein
MVSSGGGDPPCISGVSTCANGVRAGFLGARLFGGLARLVVGRRFAGGRRLVPVRRFTVVRRFDIARRFAVVRRFAAERRFTGRRFFRDERDVAARFLRFAMCCLLSGQAL